MLMYIRDRFTGWVAKFIVGLLVVSFALWGIGLYDDQGNAAEAAHVGDVSISLSTWQRSYRDLRQKMEDKMGRVLTSKDEEFIKEQSLQGLVNNEVVNQLMEEERMQISNATLRNVLTSFQVFQAEGAGFDRGRYERAILSAGYNTADFERRLRMDLLAEQLQGALVDSSFVLNYELERLARMKNQKRDYRYLGIVAENFLNLLTMDEGQIQQWYEQNQERYREPERIRIAYVDLDAKKLRAELEYEEEELRVYYEENREQFDEEEKRSVSQLIARVSSAATEGEEQEGDDASQKASAGEGDDASQKATSAGEEDDASQKASAGEEDDASQKASAGIEDTSQADADEARAVIDYALGFVVEGMPFAEIVEHSKERKGYTLEYVEQNAVALDAVSGAMAEFIVSAKQGEYSEPTRTKVGWVIAKVTDIIGGDAHSSFEIHREKVLDAYAAKEAEALFLDRLDALSSLAYEHPDTLEIAAGEVGLEIQETDFFSEIGEATGILSYSDVVQAAFSPEVRKTNSNSGAVDISDTRSVILRLVNTKPSSILPYEDVREQVQEDWKTFEAARISRERGTKIVAALKAGGDMDAIVEDYGYEWIIKENSERADSDVSRAILRMVFGMAEPPAGATRFDSIQTGAGDFFIVGLSAVRDVSLDEIKGKFKDEVRQEMLRSLASLEWQQFVQDAKLKLGKDIKYYRKNL